MVCLRLAASLAAPILDQLTLTRRYAAGILEESWEQTFLALGYVGLLLIVFEGMANEATRGVARVADV